MIVVGAVGLNGAGKDTLIDYLCRRCCVHKLSVGDIVREIAEQEDIERTRENLHKVSRSYMAEYGWGCFMQRLIEVIDKEGWEAVGIAGVRTPCDVEVLRGRFGQDLVLVHVRVGDPLVRYARLRERDEPRDPDDWEEFVAQERKEEQDFHISQTIQQANLVIENDGSLYDFHERIEDSLIRDRVADEVPCEG